VAAGGLSSSRALVFIGFMGAGKSSAAREAGAALGLAVHDADRLLEERLGEPIETFFDREGEAAFRAREEELVLELLERRGGEVVALGGGALGSERVRAALCEHVAVLVEVDVATAWERAAGRGRPLARERGAFEALYAERAAVYEGAARALLPSGDRGLAARAAPALAALRDAPEGTRLLWARSASGEYPVWLGRGLLERCPWPLPDSSRRFCVTDATVAALHAGRLRELAGLIEIEPGEEHKTLATAERVWHALVEQGVTRADHLVALGGGVVGDLAGFCAATYQRGIAVVQAPTTLVAQVDSAYGGKTGVDLPEAKNYVGAYHQPAGVIADTSTLATLPPEEHAAGYAEVVKTALIAGGALWERIASGAAVDDAVIFDCARTKLRVVAADERDGGLRQVLNLGHTVGHAIETATGYARLRHGEAVALGLLAALRLSEQRDLRERVAALLDAAGLPVRLDGLDVDAVLAALVRDKKRVGAEVPFVLVRGLGDVRPGERVDQAALRAAVAELGA
jgi:shikimate kinase / 3-dehydroquinate synthase